MKFVCHIVVLLALAALLAACGSTPEAVFSNTPAPVAITSTPSTTTAGSGISSATPEPETTATTPVISPTSETGALGDQSEAEMIAGMQEALDLYNAAYSEGDEEKLIAAVDPENRAYRRVMIERYNYLMESQLGGMFNYEYAISAIEDRGNGYYLATVLTQPRLSATAEGQAIRFMVFKQVDGRWVLSEPRRRELGTRLKHETERFTIEYYAWDENIVEEVGRLMDTAYTTVKEKLGKAPEERPFAILVPTFDALGIAGGTWLAIYDASSLPTPTASRPDRIVIRSPQSVGFSGFYVQEGWGPYLQPTITHEFTHLVVNRMFGGYARLAGGFSWMSEGLAEHVAGDPRPSEIITAIQLDNLIPLQDKSGRIEKQDLEHLYLLEADRSLAYGQSYELVDFIYTEKGGYDGWWQFVDAFDDRQSLEDAVREVFGMTVEEFEARYHDFMKTKYNVN